MWRIWILTAARVFAGIFLRDIRSKSYCQIVQQKIQLQPITPCLLLKTLSRSSNKNVLCCWFHKSTVVTNDLEFWIKREWSNRSAATSLGGDLCLPLTDEWQYKEQEVMSSLILTLSILAGKHKESQMKASCWAYWIIPLSNRRFAHMSKELKAKAKL